MISWIHDFNYVLRFKTEVCLRKIIQAFVAQNNLYLFIFLQHVFVNSEW